MLNILMNIIDTNNSFSFEKLVTFCKDASTDDMPASKNLDINDWENKPHTLLYNLFISRRFDKENRAGYIFAEQDNKYIAGAGFYPLTEDPNICIAGTRTYTIINKRGDFIHGNFVLPKQIELAKTYDYKTIILTFNEYNLWLKEGIENLGKRKISTIGRKIPDSYCGWLSLEYPINIQYTKQWCLYKHLDQSYDTDFHKQMAYLRTD
jgi:hypothetical protein